MPLAVLVLLARVKRQKFISGFLPPKVHVNLKKGADGMSGSIQTGKYLVAENTFDIAN